MDVSFSSCVRLRLRCHISSLKQAVMMILKKEKKNLWPWIESLTIAPTDWKMRWISFFISFFSVAYIDSFRLLQTCCFITRLYLLETALRSLLLGESLQHDMLKNNQLNVCNCKYKNIVPQLPAVCFHAGSLVTFMSFSRVLTQRMIQPPLSTSMKKMQVCMK